MRLNRWVRTGFLLTAIWVVGAAIHMHQADVKRTDRWAKLTYDTCTSSKQANHDADLSTCDPEREKTFRTWMEGSNADVAFVALAPIPFAWFGAFVLVYVVRAQIAGFRAVVPWGTLTRPKKLFVAFCSLCSALFVIVGIIAAMNLYADIQVPVGMSSFQDLMNNGDGFVSVTGTWRRTDLSDDTIANPLQTSKIECDRSANKCTEALASVSGTTLMADVIDYDIQSWTPDAIVLRKDSLCATELFTIDLNTKAVTGAGHTTHESDAFCATNHTDQKSWTLQLSNGFKTYWELRQRARPMPLRVIYSIFGN